MRPGPAPRTSTAPAERRLCPLPTLGEALAVLQGVGGGEGGPLGGPGGVQGGWGGVGCGAGRIRGPEQKIGHDSPVTPSPGASGGAQVS